MENPITSFGRGGSGVGGNVRSLSHTLPRGSKVQRPHQRIVEEEWGTNKDRGQRIANNSPHASSHASTTTTRRNNSLLQVVAEGGEAPRTMSDADGIDLVQEHHERSAHVDESLGRYSAYTMRLKTLVTSVSRYIAYTSDVGEAFRPLTRPIVVTTAYAISWAYIFTDVGWTCWQAAKLQDRDSPTLASDIAWIAARRGAFQSLASLVLPAVTIHSVVKHSAHLFAKFKSSRVRVAGPTAAGLLVVPLLPIVFDDPVETVVERVFDALEYRLAAYRGDEHARMSLEKGSLLRGYHIPAADESQEHGVDPSLAAQLAILGVGVDLVHVPRMRQLVARHARRVHALSFEPLATVAPSWMRASRTPTDDGPLASTSSSDTVSTSLSLRMAAQHFARRTLSQKEWDSFVSAPCLTHDERLRFLATRYAGHGRH